MHVEVECEFKADKGIYGFTAEGKYSPPENGPATIDDLAIGPVRFFKDKDDLEGRAVDLTPPLQNAIEEYAVEKLFDAVENSRSSE